MKSPFLAFILSFFLPGAGLLYIGQIKWGIINFLTVLVIGIVAAFALPDASFDNYFRYLAMACAGGSGGLAMTLAQQMKAGE